MYVQKEVDEMRKMSELEKQKTERTQQKAVNCIRAACAKVIISGECFVFTR